MQKPIMPTFPKSWYKHCPKVLEAKRWNNHFDSENSEFIEEHYAECSFVNAGFGKRCENCGKFLTRPFLNHKLDEEFLPIIEQFYNDLVKYEIDIEKWNALEKQQNVQLNLNLDEIWGTIVALRCFKNDSKIHSQVTQEIREKTFLFLDKLEEIYSKYKIDLS